jgi:hypothetical protein
MDFQSIPHFLNTTRRYALHVTRLLMCVSRYFHTFFCARISRLCECPHEKTLNFTQLRSNTHLCLVSNFTHFFFESLSSCDVLFDFPKTSLIWETNATQIPRMYCCHHPVSAVLLVPQVTPSASLLSPISFFLMYSSFFFLCDKHCSSLKN